MSKLFNNYYEFPQAFQLCRHIGDLTSSPLLEVSILSFHRLSRLFLQFINFAKEGPKVKTNLNPRIKPCHVLMNR